MKPEHVDVVVVGAGLSGIGAAVHIKQACPGRTFAVLEGREAIGGTWDLFRYPGVRSDSDMYTLGYAFRPWTHPKAIADGSDILQYIRDTAREEGIEPHIRFRQRVRRAAWSSSDALWTVEVEVGAQRELQRLTCSFLMVCSGYYNYDKGYTPDFPGVEAFRGQVVHPQRWHAGLDYVGKQVVVIGSGATAVTLVPAMAAQAAHVTMLQRSPSYVVAVASKDRVADGLRAVLPARWAYSCVRWKNVLLGMLFFKVSRAFPQAMKRLMLRGVRKVLGETPEVDKNFSPRYLPWDQRVCLLPDADLLDAVAQGRASVVTDHIESFTDSGIRLRSGAVLPADVVVTATGLDLLVLGGMELQVDGKPVAVHEAMTYKGMMLSDVPNMAYVVGYTNASWTLKADLVSAYVCRLLNHCAGKGLRQCVPRLRDPGVEAQDWVDFSSGYIQRSLHKFPRQGSKVPWRLHQNYVRDVLNLRYGPLQDSAMEFSR